MMHGHLRTTSSPGSRNLRCRSMMDLKRQDWVAEMALRRILWAGKSTSLSKLSCIERFCNILKRGQNNFEILQSIDLSRADGRFSISTLYDVDF